MKIIDKINKLLDDEKEFLARNPHITPGSPEHRAKFPQAYYSFEYFPPKTLAGEENLVDRI
jgi:methylenetetrahydrofolate reductase (NADPH)